MTEYKITHKENRFSEIVSEQALKELADEILMFNGDLDYEHENIADCIDTVESEYTVVKHIQLNGIWSYSGFDEPTFIADTIAEALDNVVVTHNYIAASTDVTDEFTHAVLEENEYVKADLKAKITNEMKEEFEGLFYEYGMWINPTYEELSSQNESVYGLNPDEYLSEVF